MRDRSLIAFAMFAACGFHPTTTELATDGSISHDVDAPATTCGACAWSCVPGDPPHCGTLVPSGGAANGSDLEGTNDVTIATSIDTGDGMNMKPKLDGAVWPDVRQVNGITIFRVGNATLTGTIAVSGKLGLAIVATGTVTINGVVDATGCDPGSPIGGFAGGGPKMDGKGSGAGSGSADDGDGGGGGGNGGSGGSGGSGIDGGAAYGSADLAVTRLVGGGGAGGGTGGGGPAGGDGGAAIQIVSNVAIQVASGGGIDAGGCGGLASNDHSGGGGGAGGTILLEAPHITILGTLAVNGGGAGAGMGTGPTADGANGTLDRIPAPGGLGTTPGASGGAGAVLVGGTGTTSATASAGGGGGVGRIRFNTATGMVDVSGILSPALEDQPTTCSVGTATVH
jgi:hypothetical protein